MKLEAKYKKVAIGLGIGILGSAAIGGTVGLISSRHGIPASRQAEAGEEKIVIEGAASFDGSLVAESAELSADLPSAADPVIVRSTDAPQRLNSISAGRQDPFSLPFIPTTSRATTAQTTAAAPDRAPATPFNPAAGQSISLIPLPTPPALPSLPAPAQGTVVAVAPTPSPTIATINVPQTPPASQGSLADSIQVTGVVQLGDRVSAIVQVPNEGSRYAQVGERIAAGQVLVKQIDVANGQEPIVILEYNGREYSRIVGGASLVGLL
ncbi:MAG: hypothetical protein AAFW84_27120 [Cyanobacteria bacterium J06635_15]